jgi:modulator of FtsH protease HflC
MQRRLAVVLGSLVLLAFCTVTDCAGSSPFYIVPEVEQVIITQFGEPRGTPVTDPGLHTKIPFVHKVNRFDKRWLEWDGAADEMPTREKTYLWVDTYARWRIVDPLKFFQSVRDERGAQSRLDDIIDSETRNVIAAHDLIEVVRSTNRDFNRVETDAGDTTAPAKVQAGRAKLTQLILEKASAAMPAFGIELRDVQFQRVNYTESVQKKVFERMVSERKRIAELYRSQGEGERNIILGKKERELRTIESEAYRKVQEINGKADADATAIYARSTRLDPKLYRLLKSLEGYRQSFTGDTTIVLSTEGEYFAPLVTGGR